MDTPTRLLFPSLPGEVRNRIYGYLSTSGDQSIATNTGLPLQTKTYKSKQTTTQIHPVHFGSTGLLALQKYGYLEAHEYYTWLLGNHVELQIRVVFGGRLSTFVQAHWDKDMELHMRKLGRMHPWLARVATYNIHILWDARDWALKGKNIKKTIGDVPDNMAKILTLLTREDVKKKNGRVDMRVYLESNFAATLQSSQILLRFPEYIAKLETLDGFPKYKTELLASRGKKVPREQWVPHSFLTRFEVLEVREKSIENSFDRKWKSLWSKEKDGGDPK